MITIQLETDVAQKEKTLQVDTGFSGWLLIDRDSYRSLGLERSELPQRYWPWGHGFGGSRRLKAAYLWVRFPVLGLNQACVVYSNLEHGDDWNLVGLSFLDQFAWSGDGEKFCLREKNLHMPQG